MAIRIQYIRREVWKRIIPFQFIPLTGIYIAVALQQGWMQSHSDTAVGIIFFAGFLLYVLFMAFLVKTLLRPDLLIVQDDGALSWRPTFSLFRTTLPTGTRVSVEDQHIVITPAVPGIPSARVEAGSSRLPVPMGVATIADHPTFRIGDRPAS